MQSVVIGGGLVARAGGKTQPEPAAGSLRLRLRSMVALRAAVFLWLWSAGLRIAVVVLLLAGTGCGGGGSQTMGKSEEPARNLAVWFEQSEANWLALLDRREVSLVMRREGRKEVLYRPPHGDWLLTFAQTFVREDSVVAVACNVYSEEPLVLTSDLKTGRLSVGLSEETARAVVVRLREGGYGVPAVNGSGIAELREFCLARRAR